MIFLSPLIFMANAMLFVAVAFRRRWAWRWVFMWSWIYVLISVVFPPMPEEFGALTGFARVLVGLEVATCLVMFFCMRHSSVKAWFNDQRKLERTGSN